MQFDESSFLNSEKIDNRYYIGSCFKIKYEPSLYLGCAITPKSFFKYDITNIKLYLYEYSNGSFVLSKSKIHIMKLYIIDNKYYVTLKTFWLRIIQRHMKKIYKRQIQIINQYKNINLMYQYEIRKNYFNKMPTIKGMLNIYKK